MAIRNGPHPGLSWRFFPTVIARPRLGRRLGEMLRAIRTRRQLARMDDRMLKDIGLSRAEALAEAGRAPWNLDPRR